MDRYRPHSLLDLENSAFRARYKVGSYSRLHISPGQKPRKKENSLPLGAGVAAFLATGATIGLGAPDTHASEPPVIRIIKHLHDSLTIDGYSLEPADFPDMNQAEHSSIVETQEAPVDAQIATQTPETPNLSSLSSVFSVMEQYPTRFTKKDFEDLEMYGQIYIEAAKKYGIDPKILWIFHQEETTSSRDPQTDVRRTVRDYDAEGKIVLQNTVQGAMQMDVNFYGPEYVKEAFGGLEHLKQIKTRSPKDVEWIAAAARKLSEDLKIAGGDYLATFKKYAAHEVATRRWEEYNWRSQVLPPFPW